jgi:hypothetical protein
MTKEQFSALPLCEALSDITLLFEKTGDDGEQWFATLISHHVIHFERELSILANQRNITDFPVAEKERLGALCADADFLEAITRRDQITVAEKHLKSFLTGQRMTFKAMGRFSDVSPAIIRKQTQSAKTPARLPDRQSLLSHE